MLSTAFFYPQESPEAVEFHKANGMGNRLTMVKDIAPIIRFLCTDGAWITGQTIFANGGYTTRWMIFRLVRKAYDCSQLLQSITRVQMYTDLLLWINKIPIPIPIPIQAPCQVVSY
mgnify:FL=1